ncbi:hypothetical protein [Alkanindiges illinoisensis]|uniref:Uncharacterized protein n=1 Tax=Alkanindiges illinoisensis TaxID=197183 RepID=A0A4Y7X914_9GAMM|nr:hypothetical protein [Alkanindiges illinoisensis]TEU23333.1 hypothetical protein E2B99_13515 [Alkanindiges illinoisensis]
MNDIIQYIPIADRVMATRKKSRKVLKQLFAAIDYLVQHGHQINHTNQHGFLVISYEQVRALLQQAGQKPLPPVDQITASLFDAKYPVFHATGIIKSSIWHNEAVAGWRFQLNRIADSAAKNQTISTDNRRTMQIDQERAQAQDTDVLLDMALGNIRIWRSSLESATSNPQVTYNLNDLVYKLLDIEQKLEKVQRTLDS